MRDIVQLEFQNSPANSMLLYSYVVHYVPVWVKLLWVLPILWIMMQFLDGYYNLDSFRNGDFSYSSGLQTFAVGAIIFCNQEANNSLPIS